MVGCGLKIHFFFLKRKMTNAHSVIQKKTATTYPNMSCYSNPEVFNFHRFNSGLIQLGSERKLKVDEYIRLYLTIHGYLEGSLDSINSKFADLCILLNCKKEYAGIKLSSYLEPLGYRMIMVSKILDGISFNEDKDHEYKFLFYTIRQLYISYGSDYIIQMYNNDM